jgi:O-antigen/teichoic acid export membrane protein
MLPAVVLPAALPGLARVSDERAELTRLLTRVWHWLAAVGLPMCAAIALFAEPAVRLVFGSEYLDAVPIVRVFALAGVLSLVNSTLDIAMVTKRLGGRMVLKNAVVLIVNIAGNVAFAPAFGVIASAWVTVASEVVAAAWAAWALAPYLSAVPALRITVRPALAVGVSSVAAIALIDKPALGIAIYASVLLVSFASLGAWPQELRRTRNPSSAAS